MRRKVAAFAAAAALAASALVGVPAVIKGDDSSERSGAFASTHASDGQPEAGSARKRMAEARRASTRRMSRPAVSPALPRTVRNSTIIRSPRRPRSERSLPSERCASSLLERAGATVSVTVPPRPGLSAQLAGGAVRIRYDTGDPPQRCRPSFISILVDNDTDPHPPRGRRLWLRGLHESSLIMPVPDYFDSAPNVVRATTGTRDGRLSPTARVLVTR
jgi:hypothetical protein